MGTRLPQHRRQGTVGNRRRRTEAEECADQVRFSFFFFWGEGTTNALHDSCSTHAFHIPVNCPSTLLVSCDGFWI